MFSTLYKTTDGCPTESIFEDGLNSMKQDSTEYTVFYTKDSIHNLLNTGREENVVKQATVGSLVEESTEDVFDKEGVSEGERI